MRRSLTAQIALIAGLPLAVAAAPAGAADACPVPSSEVVLDQGLLLPPAYGEARIVVDSFVCSVDLLFRNAACGDGGAGYGTVSWSDRSAAVRAQWAGTTIVLTGGATGELTVTYDVADCATPEGARHLTVSGTALAL